VDKARKGATVKLIGVRRMDNRLMKFFWKSIPKNRCVMYYITLAPSQL